MIAILLLIMALPRMPQSAELCYLSESLVGRPDIYGVAVLGVSPSGTLDTLWGLDHTLGVGGDIRVFPEVGTVLIREGEAANAVDVLSIRSLQVVQRYDVSSVGTFAGARQYDSDEPLGQLALWYMPDSSKTARTIWVSPSLSTGALSTEAPAGELRLAGTGSLNCADPDIASIRSVTTTPIELIIPEPGIDLTGFPVPDSIVTTKTAPYWNIIAQEPQYMALVPVPDRAGDRREMLIFNRLTRQWYSLSVPGDNTYLRPLNGWIVGEVTRSNPRNDWERRVGYPGIATDSSVLIEPKSLQQICVRLGSDSEILWADSAIVVYRIVDSLFQADLMDGELANRQLLITDKRIKDIHWAFRR